MLNLIIICDFKCCMYVSNVYLYSHIVDCYNGLNFNSMINHRLRKKNHNKHTSAAEWWAFIPIKMFYNKVECFKLNWDYIVFFE